MELTTGWYTVIVRRVWPRALATGESEALPVLVIDCIEGIRGKVWEDSRFMMIDQFLVKRFVFD